MKLSEVLVENDNFRFDNEFFLKTYIKAEQQIKQHKYIKLLSLVEVITDYHANGSYASLNSNVKILNHLEYSYMVRSTDLEKNDFLSDVRHVNEHSYNFLKKSKLYGGELLVNKIGRPGQFYLAPKLKKPMTLGMNLFLIKIKPTIKFNNHFLWVYFNTKLGQRIVQRKINGTAPFSIDKNSILSLPIPVLSIKFQDQISNLVTTSHDKLEPSKTLYAEAENILLKELGLLDFKPSTENIAIKTLSESFGASGRLDAEYYQPKYEEVVEKILNYTNGCKLFNKLIKNYSTGCPYKSDTYQSMGVPLIRINNIKGGILDLSNVVYIPYEDKNLSLQNITKKGDIIISMSGTIGSSCKISNSNESVINQRIMRISLIEFDSDVMVLIINSIVGLVQLERIGTGGVQTNISSNDIQQMLIPIIDHNIQQHISSIIKQSFELKAESKHLLEIAKQAVELAIEENEDKALNWINEQIEGVENKF